MQVVTDTYRENWDRIFGHIEILPKVYTKQNVVPRRVEFECSLCHKKHPSTSYFESSGIAHFPNSLTSIKKNDKWLICCSGQCQALNCACCDKEATHNYFFSPGVFREDKIKPMLPSPICSEHVTTFKRFAGSIEQLTKGLEL